MTIETVNSRRRSIVICIVASLLVVVMTGFYVMTLMFRSSHSEMLLQTCRQMIVNESVAKIDDVDRREKLFVHLEEVFRRSSVKERLATARLLSMADQPNLISSSDEIIGQVLLYVGIQLGESQVVECILSFQCVEFVQGAPLEFVLIREWPQNAASPPLAALFGVAKHSSATRACVLKLLKRCCSQSVPQLMNDDEAWLRLAEEWYAQQWKALAFDENYAATVSVDSDRIPLRGLHTR